MVEALLVNGAKVFAIGRSESLAERVKEWQNRFGMESVQCCLVDMYDLPALDSVLDSILAQQPAIDILVNNAYELSPNTGFNSPKGSLELATYDQWHRHFLNGIYWPSLTVQKLGEGLKASGHGSIVNIATMYSVVAPSPALYANTEKLNPPGYSAAKAGLLAFTRYTASFWGQYGVRSNAILPGPFSNTVTSTGNSVDPSDPFLHELSRRTCLGRTGTSQELVGALLFLGSDASSYVTGHGLVVDGGWTVT
jgi:gluconate 5-dehydrogenase